MKLATNQGPAASGPATSIKIRCRQIADSDLEALGDLLAEGFAGTAREYWSRGLARLALLAPVEGMPRFGYALEADGRLVGALLVLSSMRGTRIVANVSSWHVREPYTAHSTLMVAMATKRKDVTYLNISPAPHTWRTAQAQRYVPYNFGRSAAFPVLGWGGGKVGTHIPDDLPEAELLRAHRALGCISVVCEKDGAVFPFVFKPRRLARPPVKMMELIYCRGTESFERCGAALGRHFLKSRVLGFLLDGKVRAMPSHYAAGKEPRYFRGPQAPALNDLAFTEKVIFG